MMKTSGTWMLAIMILGAQLACVPAGSDKAQVFTLSEAPVSRPGNGSFAKGEYLGFITSRWDTRELRPQDHYSQHPSA